MSDTDPITKMLDEQERQRLAIQKGKRVYAPPKDNIFHPLRNFPRNAPCFCGSKFKFKHCHKDKLPECVERKEGAAAAQYLKDYLDGKNPPPLKWEVPVIEQYRGPDKALA